MSPINDAVRINKAPMQGLRERIAAQQGEIAALKAEVAELRAIVQPPSLVPESATFTILLARLREYGAWVSGDWRKAIWLGCLASIPTAFATPTRSD